LITDKIDAIGALLMGLKGGHIITKPFAEEEKKNLILFTLNADFNLIMNFTNGCQRDKSVIN
jgi:hypothetical protein